MPARVARTMPTSLRRNWRFPLDTVLWGGVLSVHEKRIPVRNPLRHLLYLGTCGCSMRAGGFRSLRLYPDRANWGYPVNVVSLPDFRKSLISSIRKGHKRAKQAQAEVSKAQAQSHHWHFGRCLDCGVSSTETQNDICEAIR